MRKFLITLLLLTSMFSVSVASDQYKAIEAADAFFVKMQNRDLPEMWNMLTKKSKKIIINDIVKASEDSDDALLYGDVEKDFVRCGSICKSYWEGFLGSFDPGLIVNDTEWKIKEASDDKVTISLHYKDSKSPAFLYVYFQNKQWKIGLTESFWLRKRFN